MRSNFERDNAGGVEKNIAVCYLYNEGDIENQCVLTTKQLKVTYRKTQFSFILNTISEISIEKKKLLLPIIVGGVIIPLSISAFIKYSMDPFWTTIIILGGFFIFYIGWNGSRVLNINSNGQVFLFPFRQHNIGITKFVNYSFMIMKGMSGRNLYYYIPVRKEDIGLNSRIDYILNNREKLNVFDYYSILEKIEAGSYKEDDIIYTFDPLNSSIRIQYLRDDKHYIIRPFFDEQIKTNDFIKICSVIDFYSFIKMANPGKA